MIQSLILILTISLSGFPVGLLIANLTKEELKAGEPWFKLLVYTTLSGVLLSFLFAKSSLLVFLVSSFIFILLLALASLIYPKLFKKNGTE